MPEFQVCLQARFGLEKAEHTILRDVAPVRHDTVLSGPRCACRATGCVSEAPRRQQARLGSDNGARKGQSWSFVMSVVAVPLQTRFDHEISG